MKREGEFLHDVRGRKGCIRKGVRVLQLQYTSTYYGISSYGSNEYTVDVQSEECVLGSG